ncbi:MAG: FAD-dependent oxidoreductase [Acidimicrobiales bacterium]
MDHDLIILGAGAGGLGAARAARWAGADVAMVTEGPPGGDCTFTGCVPSKTLLAAAAQGVGYHDAMRRVVETVAAVAATESVDVLRREGVTMVEGRGRLVAHDAIAVGDRRITAPRIVIATGARPSVPPIPGLDRVEVLTTDEVFGLTTQPRSLGIVGGGPIGCELALAFARLGVAVALVESLPRLLPREEPEASEVIGSALRAAGDEVRTAAAVGGSSLPAGASRSTSTAMIEVEKLLVRGGSDPQLR